MKKKIYHLIQLDKKETSLGYHPNKGDLEYIVNTIACMYAEYNAHTEFRVDIYRGRTIPKKGTKPVASFHITGWWSYYRMVA